MSHQMLLILDFGSQYTQLIARRVREHGVFCQIRPCTDPAPEVMPRELIGLILSGGPASVLTDDAPPFDERWLDVDVPVLGVCYGMQLLTHLGGGTVGRGTSREYGAARFEVVDGECPLVGNQVLDGSMIWMSHGDHVERPPEGYRVVGMSRGVIAAIASQDDRRFGLQFHPEVTHSEGGSAIIGRFVRDLCGGLGDWTASVFIDEQVEAIRERVGDAHVVCGLSGGVDSSVTAALIHRAIGERLHCIFVDHGLNRKDEVTGVREEFQDLRVQVVDAQDRFLNALGSEQEPERKRQIIGRTFIRVFEECARALPNVRFLAQGTLYPDVIESVSVRGPSATIKSHHNVGGLPERMDLELIEPLRELFKDEVRAVGTALGLSDWRVWRHPFPGPGLGIRCLGLLSRERLATLREADAIVRDELRIAGLHRSIWQAFAVLLPVRSVGVMGDERTYQETCVIRAVQSTDGMTANWARLPWDVLSAMSARIINEVPGINRVTYDISHKPPATIEWE